MFAFDEQSDFQKPFAVERKRVCDCVRETSQTALGAVCANVTQPELAQTQTCFRLKITPLAPLLQLTSRANCNYRQYSVSQKKSP